MLLESVTHGLLALGEFNGDVGALERLQDRTHIFDTHTGHVLEERNQSHERLVLRVTLPFVENNRVLGLQARMFFLGVNHNHLGQISVQVRKILISRG